MHFSENMRHIDFKILLASFIFCINLCSAQSNIKFEAISNAKEVLVNNYFEVSFSLKNANGSDFSAPDFGKFIVTSGPNSTKSVQFINGIVSQEMGYSYTLVAEKEGNFTIGPASIKANGKVYKTSPITIKVLKGDTKANGKASDQKAYIVIIPSKTTAYPGEQILLDFKLYTTVSLDGYDIIEEPEYQGFYVQELRRYNSFTQSEVINGKQVTTKILRRLALFPQQSGDLTISPARLQLAVIEDNNRSGFFFSRNIKPLAVTTEPITISVKDLPANPPNDFTGAVGNYSFQSSVNRMQASTDDAISTTMIITGNGDMKRVQFPPLILSDSFEVYPPRIVEEKTVEDQGELINRKVVEYLVLPKYPGKYSISPSFSYFDPATDSYHTIQSGPYQIAVKQGSDRHVVRQKVLKNLEASSDIRFIKTEAVFEKKGIYFVGSPLFWSLTSFPVFAFIGLFLLKKKQDQNQGKDIGAWKTKHANHIAQQRLSLADEHLKAEDSRKFYDEISKAALGYVCDKLEIPLSQLSKDNVHEKLSSLGVGESLIQDFLEVIQTCEMALFAGKNSTNDMEGIYKKAISVISGIEEEIGVL